MGDVKKVIAWTCVFLVVGFILALAVVQFRTIVEIGAEVIKISSRVELMQVKLDYLVGEKEADLEKRLKELREQGILD